MIDKFLIIKNALLKKKQTEETKNLIEQIDRIVKRINENKQKSTE